VDPNAPPGEDDFDVSGGTPRGRGYGYNPRYQKHHNRSGSVGGRRSNPLVKAFKRVVGASDLDDEPRSPIKHV
jgi:hypothetical protein